MNWLLPWQSTQPVPHAVGVLALACMAGMALGCVKVRGVGLGPAGELFAGIVTGPSGKPVDRHTLDVVKECGLIFRIDPAVSPLSCPAT